MEEVVASGSPRLDNTRVYFAEYKTGDYLFGIEKNSRILVESEEFYDTLSRPRHDAAMDGKTVLEYFIGKNCDYKTEPEG